MRESREGQPEAIESRLEAYTPVERLEVRADNIVPVGVPFRARNSDSTIDDGSDGVGMKGGSLGGVMKFLGIVSGLALTIGGILGFLI